MSQEMGGPTPVERSAISSDALRATLNPMAGHRQLRWLLGRCLPPLLAALGCVAVPVVGLLWIAFTGMAEMRALGPWPGRDAKPEDLVAVDLSHLDLSAGPVLDARDAPGWASLEWQYLTGSVASYLSGKEVVVQVWALRYATPEAALADFSAVDRWAEEVCGLRLISGDVIRCQHENAVERIYWHDAWIVDLVAMAGTEYEPGQLADHVRNAIAAHWRLLRQAR